MKKLGDFVCKNKLVIIIVSLLLLIPTIIGIKNTRINYDILVYLPDDIETMKGQKILSEDFNMGAFSVSIIDNMNQKDILKFEEKVKKIDGVEKVVSIADITGTTIPLDFLPEEITKKVIKDKSTLLLITFKETTSNDQTLNAVKKIRKIGDNSTKIGGMSAMVLDTMELSNQEITIYVVIAVILCIIVLSLFLDSYIVPILLLLNIGLAILYNMGTNIILGDISYITKAISSVLQLGVTTDFSIFLYHKYEKSKIKNKDKNKAMSTAIKETLVSVLGSSLTTIAGFLALCTMTLTLGSDIGLVMAKGVLFGLICVVTVFPSLLLIFDKLIDKTHHKALVPQFNKTKEFVIKHYKLIFILFLLMFIPATIGNFNTKVYYNLDKSLPKTLDSSIANEELKEKFNIVSPEVILIDKNLETNKKQELVKKIKKIEGIDLVLSGSSLSEIGLDEEFLSDDITNIYKTEKYEMIFVNSIYGTATNELNNQITKVNELVKSVDKNAIIAGEGPLMKDLVEISDNDFKNVNYSSLLVIFIIMIFVLKSISLPVILIAAIEFAIFINMAIPYYTNTTIPFIASIVIGTIQLGATIDYAILMTTKYLEKRKTGKDKFESVRSALNNSVSSIFVSGMCFFAATIGVGIYSKLEMIGSLCTLISRGALISMAVVILVLPSLLLIFDKLICKTSIGFGGKKMKNVKKVAVLLVVSLFGINNVSALTKDETVYTKLNYDGTIKNTFVNEHLISSEKEINDVTNLKDILNINGDEKFSINGNNIKWNNLGSDIYYRGTITKDLPITTNVVYKLNGKEMKLKDMLGKKGKVEIIMNFTNNDQKSVLINGSYQYVYTPFVVTVGTILPNDIKNIEVTNGKIVSNGKNNILVAIAAPGLSESLGTDLNLNNIKISYETDNFELKSIYMVTSPKILSNVDLSVFNKLDDVYSKTNTLKESSSKLVSGVEQLKNGLQELKYGTNELKSTLDNNINNLENSSSIDNETLLYIKNLAVEQATNSIKEMEESIRNTAIEEATNSVKNSETVIRDSAVNQVMNTLSEDKINYITSVVMNSLVNNQYYLYLASNPQQKAMLDGIISGVVKSVTETVSSTVASDVAYNTAISISQTTASNTAYNTSLMIAGSVAEQVSGNVALQVSKTAKDSTIKSLYTLSEAIAKLNNGVEELYNGSNALNDGMKQFDEEGIQSICNLVNNNLKTLEDRAKTLINLSKEYNTFTMKEKNVGGTTKFVSVIEGKNK